MKVLIKILSTMMVRQPWTWLKLTRLTVSFGRELTGIEVHQCQGCKEIWSSLCGSSAQNTGELYIYALELCSEMKMQLEGIKILSNFLC